MIQQIHQGLPLLEIGDSLADAERIVILLHGRGASAESMTGLARALHRKGTRFMIPQAYQNRWYPQTAFGPLEPNEPDLSSALSVIDALISDRMSEGFRGEQVILGGFSQGACLAAEYLARNPARYGGLFVLSGALIGPPDEDREPAGDLDGTPVFVGGSDVDPWVKVDLFRKTERLFSLLRAAVELEIYPGMGHIINQEEISRVRKLISGVKLNST